MNKLVSNSDKLVSNSDIKLVSLLLILKAKLNKKMSYLISVRKNICYLSEMLL